MREVAFLRQNADKWKRFEALLDESGDVDPDALAELFIELTDDLAYARTFYPESRTTVYLNALAARVYQSLYRNRKEDRSRFITFWTHEVPVAFYHARTEMLVAFVLFLVAVGIGALSTKYDDTFVRLILGDAYVNMTLENIEHGDPMRVYKEMNQTVMFLGITINNVFVALRAFAFGILFSLGTAYVLFQNGVMLGAFQMFFAEQDLLWTSVRTVWIHGTLEISAIILAGAAGLVLGNALLFPGTYTRLESLKRGAKAGLKMVIGLVPVFIVAGFLEGFVTRLTEMPDLVSILIITGSLAFVIWYFVIRGRFVVDRS